jgi:class 3 adenylate cyclase
MSTPPDAGGCAPSAESPQKASAEAPSGGALPSDCRAETLGVAFFDLSRMSEWSSSEADTRVASFFQAFYELAAGHVEPAGGRIVKFMGDAGLAVFPTEAAEGVIFALCELTAAARARAREFGLDTYLNVSVHVGPVLAGSFGPEGAERFDVVGKTVNIAARLGRRGVTLSPQAFRCLGAEARKRFQKITPPVTYRFRA